MTVLGFPSAGERSARPVWSGSGCARFSRNAKTSVLTSSKAFGFCENAKGITPKGRRSVSDRSPSETKAKLLAFLPLFLKKNDGTRIPPLRASEALVPSGRGPVAPGFRETQKHRCSLRQKPLAFARMPKALPRRGVDPFRIGVHPRRKPNYWLSYRHF